MFEQISSEDKTKKIAGVSGKNSSNSDNKLIKERITPECFVTIVIPVRNEAKTIRETLKSFLKQIDLDSQPINSECFELIILANNCTDNSVEIVKNFRNENPHLKIHTVEINLNDANANVGFVRRLLMNEAYQRLRENKFRCGVIMTTDGDTIVADKWIAANLHEIEKGADAVGGRIFISAQGLAEMEEACREIHLRDEEYRLLTAEIEALIDDLPFDDAPRHHQHFNGSFAVTTEIYEKSGGVPNVKFLEDCAFFDVLQRIDARVRHSFDVEVYTSARHVGRSEVGLSFQINQWKNLSEKGEDFTVESAHSIVQRFEIRRDLRKLRRDFLSRKVCDSEKFVQISARVCIAPESILDKLEKTLTFGAFYEDVMNECDKHGTEIRNFPPVALSTALRELKNEVEKHRVQCFSQTSMR